MASLKYDRASAQPRRCLLVMLPGRGDHAEEYARHGFIEALRKRPLAVDVVTADATFGYYARRTLMPRLREDVIEPAKAKGYEQVWFLGISMGGLGSLLYAKANPEFTGIVLLAPFLGDNDVIEEISKAGGVTGWTPGVITEDDYQHDLWRYLKESVAKGAPRITLGVGEEDRLAAGHRLLASALPADHVFRTSGAHDWPTWTKLWDTVLTQSDFATSCAEQTGAAQ